MQELDVVIERTPIEIALKVDNDGYTTARKLYKWLELDESHYARWVNTNILENPFAEEGVDYVPIKSKRKGRGRFSRNYKITASFAKKLATILRSGKGERARIYFAMVNDTLIKLSEEQRKLYIEKNKNDAVRKALSDILIHLLKEEQRNWH